MKNFSSGGFSLMELMVVLVVTGVLASLAVPSYLIHVQRTRTVEARNVLMSVYAAQKDYRRDNGEYASRLRDLDVELSQTMVSYKDLAVYRDTTVSGQRVLASVKSNDDSYTLYISDQARFVCVDAPCARLGF